MVTRIIEEGGQDADVNAVMKGYQDLTTIEPI